MLCIEQSYQQLNVNKNNKKSKFLRLSTELSTLSTDSEDKFEK